MRKSSLAVLSLFSFLLLFTSVSVAQLGEVAGQPHFNVSLGSHNSIIITVVNQAGYPLPVKVVLPTLTSTTANTITPKVTAVPMVGNVPSGGDLHINVTVYVPEGGANKPGDTWTGVLQVVTIPTSSSGSGAQIIEGVAKVVTITATQHITTLWDYVVPIGIVVIIIVGVALLVAYRKGMIGKKKTGRQAKKTVPAAASGAKGRAAGSVKKKGKLSRRSKGKTRPRARKGGRRARRRRNR